MYSMKECGMRIKKLRLDKGITQENMADALGIHQETLGRIERGTRGTTIDLLSIIAGYLDTSLDYLVDGKQTCAIEMLSGLTEEQQKKVICIMKCVVENI